ncbi:unnamed protein product [Blepharisma stoltei]|uniref:Sulfite exporter TauE/SafE n=1 Tax=Blepharisma stoltei TaxID=1481888 RepID=A0AAU9JZ55_9CILI|nr:unnamed protein product [Blepharisma stoltei]
MNKIVIACLLIALVHSESCKDDNDCTTYSSCKNGTCKHKDLFPIKDLEWVGSFLIVIVSALSNTSGIGGGALNVLICLVLFNFDTTYSVPLSTVIVFGGSLATIIIQIPSRHPAKNRPLIDYNIALFVISPMLFGATVGVILNKVFPSWLILALLMCVLIFMLYNSLKKYNKLRIQESNQRKILRDKRLSNANSEIVPIPIQSQDKNDLENENCPKIDEKDNYEMQTPNIIDSSPIKNYESIEREWKCSNNNGNEQSQISNANEKDSSEYFIENEKETNPELENIYKSEKRIILFLQFFYILVIFGLAILGSVMKGGKGLDSILGFEQCSDWYWIYFAFFLAFLLLLCFLAEIYIVRKVKRKIELGYDFDEHDVKWNLKNSTIVSTITILAGILASLLGLGGGLVMNPIMLNIGYRPEVSTSTSSFLVLLTSAISMVQYAIAGSIIYNYGFWMFGCSVIGSSTGTFLILKTVKKYKRVSIVVLILGIMMLLSLIGVPLYGIIDMIDKSNKGKLRYGFADPCG